MENGKNNGDVNETVYDVSKKDILGHLPHETLLFNMLRELESNCY